MEKQRTMRYFLGGNTADGFYSLYDSFVSREGGDFLWIVKGGAGCGKSSFMKTIGTAAERAGLDVEYAQCSGDPDSLDGVYIPELKTAYTDGTAPHAQDARIAAVDSGYIDLGQFYDRAALAEHRAELAALVAENKWQYKKAYSLLSAAGSLRRGWSEGLLGEKEKSTVISRADRIAARELGKTAKDSGRAVKRFISANTCKGLLRLPECRTLLCTRGYCFENRAGLGYVAIERLARRALEAGFDVVLCPDPLTPELCEALFVPSARLGFFCGDKRAERGGNVKNIRLDNLLAQSKRAELRACEKLTGALMSEAYAALGDAKRVHDEIESIYNPHVDFDGVYQTVNEHLAMLGLERV